MVAIVAIPLWLSTTQVISQEHLYKAMKKHHIIFVDKKRVEIYIEKISQKKKRSTIDLDVISATELTSLQKEILIKKLKKIFGKDRILIINYKIAVE